MVTVQGRGQFLDFLELVLLGGLILLLLKQLVRSANGLGLLTAFLVLALGHSLVRILLLLTAGLRSFLVFISLIQLRPGNHELVLKLLFESGDKFVIRYLAKTEAVVDLLDNALHQVLLKGQMLILLPKLLHRVVAALRENVPGGHTCPEAVAFLLELLLVDGGDLKNLHSLHNRILLLLAYV